MSTKLIGQARQGRQIAKAATGVTEKPIEIKAAHGDGTTAGSANEFLKFTGTSGAGESGEFNITTADVTNNTNAGGILVDVNGTQRYIPIYAITP
jgi:hypothetical protein